MSQEVSKRLGSAGYDPNISHLSVGYNPLIQTIDPNFQQDILLLMAEILHHLRLVVELTLFIIHGVFIHPSWCRISEPSSTVGNLFMGHKKSP